MAWTPPTQDEVKGYFDKLNNWRRWGEADQVGTLNLITPEKRRAALKLAQRGRPVSLARDIVRIFIEKIKIRQAEAVLEPVYVVGREQYPYAAAALCETSYSWVAPEPESGFGCKEFRDDHAFLDFALKRLPYIFRVNTAFFLFMTHYCTLHSHSLNY
jgi:hypothetical protein